MRDPRATSAIISKFFYSYREGELQRSHRNMLRSILYEVLQQDEGFFYHRFQIEYRSHLSRNRTSDWDYASLKNVLRSLQNYPCPKPIFLVVDAVDESEEDDRRDMLNLMFELCDKTKCSMIKVFMASRPVGQLDIHHDRFRNIIRLQEQTRDDIYHFTSSFLNGLSLTYVLAQATEYIVENAQGVFLWVKLIGEELIACHEEGFSESEIFDYLKKLPKELSELYLSMFQKMCLKKSDLRDGLKIFRFLLFGRRLVTAQEAQQVLAISDTSGLVDSMPDLSFRSRIPPERRITVCGNNFLELKTQNGEII